MQKIADIGSFTISMGTCSLGKIYFVNYNPEHKSIYSWQFINDLPAAEEFCKKKTRIDRKLFKGEE